jgi:4a-hydroxytetrahydrobiopterin dehydratase
MQRPDVDVRGYMVQSQTSRRAERPSLHISHCGCIRIMSELANKTCVPCRGGVPPLKGKELADLHRQLPEWAHWKIVNEHHITRTFTFPDFKQALDFVNRVGRVAEEQGHHPDILLTWGKVEITLWTHKIDGLTESDFIMAARIDGLS